MREGTNKVRDVLGHDVSSITDEKIQEALWHYYYDIEKSINYLLGTQTKKAKEVKGKKGQGVLYFHERSGNDITTGGICSYGFGRSGACFGDPGQFDYKHV